MDKKDYNKYSDQNILKIFFKQNCEQQSRTIKQNVEKSKLIFKTKQKS